MRRMPEKVSETYRTPLGRYRGLDASIVLHPLGGTEVVLDGKTRCRETLLRDNPGPRAVLNALERLADSYAGEIRRAGNEIGIKRGQLADFEGRVGRPFGHLEYQSQLTDLRDQLKIGLSEHPSEGGVPVAELAGKIKELRATNTVEATPERVVRKALAGERPVTARIRRREVAESVEEPVAVPPPVQEIRLPEPVSPAAITMPEPVRPVNGHARAVVSRRQAGEEQLRLF